MKLPDELWVGSTCFIISGDSSNWARYAHDVDDPRQHALTSWKNGEMVFEPYLSDQVLRETFFHEVLHAVFAIGGNWNATPDPEEAYDEFEEHVVGRLSPWIHSVLCDPRNRPALAFILGTPQIG